MKILNTNLFNTPSPFFIKQRNFSPVFTGLEPIKTDKAEFKLSPEERALSNLNKITKKEYDSLTKDEKMILREKSEKYIKELIGRDLKEDILIHQNAAEAIKQVFDKQFGKGNYVVISIGRSLSSIGKMLALKIGEENVKNIPMSAMQRYYTYAYDVEDYNLITNKFASADGFEHFKKHLASIGLTKEEVEKSNKHFILMDYAVSGKSLGAAYTILTSDYLLGNEKRNIHKVSDTRVLCTIKNKNPHLSQLDSILDRAAFKNYSFIAPVYSGFKIIEKAADYQKIFNDNPRLLKLIKYFGFALLDSEFSENSKPACHFEIEPVKDKWDNGNNGDSRAEGLKTDNADMANKVEMGLKNQDKKIWNSSVIQFIDDVDNDSNELCKLLTRLEKPLKELSSAKKKYEYSSSEETENLTRKLIKEIETKFPLEYEYYSNQRKFKKLILSKTETENYTPHIYQKVKGFEKESKLYRFFEEIDEKSHKILEGKFEDNNESAFKNLQKAQNILLHCAQDIKSFQFDSYYIKDYIFESMRFSKCEKDSNEFKIMQDFYSNIHHRINKILLEISKEYTPEKCKEFIETIDNNYKNAVAKRDKQNKAILLELNKKLSNIKIKHNQNELKLALEKQKAALANAYDTMLPF